MTSSTHDRVQQALDDSRLRKAGELFLCFNLGIKRSNESLFENNLVNLMPCIQASAFSLDSTAITQDALHHAMRFYNGPSEQSRHIVASTRALFAASLRLAAMGDERGLLWSCFMISNTPMVRAHQLSADDSYCAISCELNSISKQTTFFRFWRCTSRAASPNTFKRSVQLCRYSSPGRLLASATRGR